MRGGATTGIGSTGGVPDIELATTHPSVTEMGSAVGQPPSVGVYLLVAAIVVGTGAVVLRRHRWLRWPRAARPSSGANEDDAGRCPSRPAAPRTDEDRVETLLRSNDGRMRQSAIVDSTGWSKSKVSVLLSEMEEADRVRKLRVGRENLVSLPGAEPDAARRPSED